MTPSSPTPLLDLDLEPFIGYIRVSTWREEKISPELQRTAIEQWAARTGRRIVDWVIDLDATGRNFKRRIMSAIERVENGEARGIVVWRYSRFGRNRTGNAVNLARLEAVGGQLESATEPVDAKTAVGELQREMIFAFGNFESNRAGEQWRETHAYRIAQKLPATGRPRFGYIWHPRRVPDPTAPGGWRLQQERYELHPDHAPIVEELYERKIAGQGFNGLAHWLNEELRVTTTRGGAWGVSSIARYLDSGFAAGLLRVHDKECPCGYSRGEVNTCPYKRMILIPGAQPAIITPDQWEAYKRHRETIKALPPRARKATYTLTGLLRHGYCHHHMSAASTTTRKGEQLRGHWLVCSRHKHANRLDCPKGINVKREKIEADVLAWLAREAAPGVDAAPSVPGPRPATEDDPQARALRERVQLQAELDKIEKAIDRLVTGYAMDPDKYPEDSFERVRDKLTAQRAELTTRLRHLAKEEDLPQREKFQPLVVGLLDEWETLTVVERNAILRQLIRRVVVHDVRNEKGRIVETRTEVHPVWEPDPWDEGTP